MRVIAGTARRLNLKTIEGRDTRPTTDRIKETLFNMIQLEVPDVCFLDLFSGSGSIGIEALSRGAKEAYFVENNKAAAACIRDNLKFTRLEEKAVVMECDAATAIRRLNGKRKKFGIIFMDPPYNMEWEKQALSELKLSDILDENTMIIVEAPIKADFAYVKELGFSLDRQKEYKTNKHVFLSLQGENHLTEEERSHEESDISGKL